MAVIGCEKGKFYITKNGEPWENRAFVDANVDRLVEYFDKNGIPHPLMESSSIEFSEEDGVVDAAGIIEKALIIMVEQLLRETIVEGE